MRKSTTLVLTALAVSALSATGQVIPGAPENSGLTPKGETMYINLPSGERNNGRVESLGVAIGQNGNVIVGWEDDGEGLLDQEAVWTLFNSAGVSITPPTILTTIDPELAGQTLESKYLSYFRKDGTAVSGRTSWGPKIKASWFSDAFGMGATSFGLGVEVPEFAGIQVDAGGGGDFPSVQLLTGSGAPIGIVSGMSDADAEPEGDVRIGDWEFLSNGNIVVVGESRQQADLAGRFGGETPQNHAVFRIVTPTGEEVKGYTLVSEVAEKSEIWHGVGVTENGFAVRFANAGGQGTVRLFDNTGKPITGNIDLSALTGAAAGAGAGGRGDGAGFHGNGKDAYVVAAGSGAALIVTVLNADGTLRFSRDAAEGLSLGGVDRVDAALTPEGRVLVVFNDGAAASTAGAKFIQGRFLKANGDLDGGSFYISELETPELTALESRRPRVAWRNDLAAVVWESRNHPEGGEPPPWVVSMRLFSTFKPGTAEAAGLTRIVPDRPIIVPAENALGNWEPYASVLGSSTFLIEGNTFADGATDLQRYVVALQPAAGGNMRLGEGFYADNGQPFKNQINASRQNGNPGRVAGDKRPGAVNFVVGAEASPHVYPEFQSDNRWNLGFDRLADGRYGIIQTFSLDPVSLTQTPLHKALDSANGRLTSGDPQGNNQITRFGGDLAVLSDGNILSVVEDRSRVINPDGNAAVATVFTPAGGVVKESFMVAPGDIWSNVAAYQGGFAVRVAGVLYFFNNAGEAQGQVDQNTAGVTFDRGRGDGQRIFAHINSPFVYLVGNVGTIIKVAAWDSRDRSFVAITDGSDAGFTGGVDRANGAVDALNRLTIAWVSQPSGYAAQQIAARVLQLNPATKTFSALTPGFLAFVNASTNETIRSVTPTVAMTTKQICVAAKGEINLQNNPSAGANSARELNFFTVVSHPAPAEDPTAPVGGGPGEPPRLLFNFAAGNLTLSWDPNVTGFTLGSNPRIVGGTWTPVSGVVNNSVTIQNSLTISNLFFRLRR